MKKYLFLLAMITTPIFAQDVIVKKDGSTILSKVLEISTSEIKYKKFSNINGPTYSISPLEVLTINYENGEKEDYTRNDSKDLHQELQNSVLLRYGMEIPVRLVSPIKARDVSVGQEVAFRTINDVIVDGVTTIPSGTPVKGIVYQAKKSSWFGTKGRLGINLDHLTLNDGMQIPLKGNVYVTGKNRTALSVVLFLFVTMPACFICGTKAQLLSGYETMAILNASVQVDKKGKYTIIESQKSEKNTVVTNQNTVVTNKNSVVNNNNRATIVDKYGNKEECVILSENDKYLYYNRVNAKGKVERKERKIIKHAIEKIDYK